MQTIDEDYIEELFMTTTHHYIMFFTNTGRVYRLKAYKIPESGRTARGSTIVNLLQLQPGEKITAVIPLVDYEEGKYLLMATKYGVVKKSSIMEYAKIRKTGLAAITLKDDDQLIEVKYTEDDGHVTFTVRTNDRQLYISVADNGPGISDSDKKKIFDRFYRVDKARTRQKGGFGLGLSLAQQIVLALKGTIVVKDNQPKGTIFEVKITGV